MNNDDDAEDEDAVDDAVDEDDDAEDDDTTLKECRSSLEERLDEGAPKSSSFDCWYC